MSNKRQSRIKRHKRIRAKISGTAQRPRLSIFRSNKHVHLQLVDDSSGRTLAAASTVKDHSPVKSLKELAAKLGIKSIVFDRSGYQYHGTIARLAEELRKAGLTF